jgi:hypothetical protein
MVKYDDFDRKRLVTRRHKHELPPQQNGHEEPEGSNEPREEANPESISIDREDEHQRQQQLDWAMAFVFGDLKDRLSQRLPAHYREGFLHAVEQIKSLLLETETFDAIVTGECGEVTQRTRNRIYQRHSRVREQYLDWVEEEMTSAGLSLAQESGVKGVVSQMRR